MNHFDVVSGQKKLERSQTPHSNEFLKHALYSGTKKLQNEKMHSSQGTLHMTGNQQGVSIRDEQKLPHGLAPQDLHLSEEDLINNEARETQMLEGS